MYIDGSRLEPELPSAEKQARYEKVRQKILGFLVQGETEPSHAMLDKCQLIYDTGAIVWLSPSMCTKREAEVQAALKHSQQVLRIEAQTLKVNTEGPKVADADHGSEIKLQWCFQRRGWHLRCASWFLGKSLRNGWPPYLQPTLQSLHLVLQELLFSNLWRQTKRCGQFWPETFLQSNLTSMESDH